jgi:hypothetical protein
MARSRRLLGERPEFVYQSDGHSCPSTTHTTGKIAEGTNKSTGLGIKLVHDASSLTRSKKPTGTGGSTVPRIATLRQAKFGGRK